MGQQLVTWIPGGVIFISRCATLTNAADCKEHPSFHDLAHRFARDRRQTRLRREVGRTNRFLIFRRDRLSVDLFMVFARLF